MICKYSGCSGLTSITIGNSVTSIGDFTFDGCYRLTDVYCYAESVPDASDDSFSNYLNATLHVPATSLDAYKTTDPWSRFGQIVALTDEEVSIDNITIKETKAKEVYDLGGRHYANSVKCLPRGMCIINGKKIVIR